MHENGLHKNFPPFPFFMPYIVHYLWSRKNKGSWRFLPCDAWSRPKELPFV